MAARSKVRITVIPFKAFATISSNCTTCIDTAAVIKAHGVAAAAARPDPPVEDDVPRLHEAPPRLVGLVERGNGADRGVVYLPEKRVPAAYILGVLPLVGDPGDGHVEVHGPLRDPDLAAGVPRAGAVGSRARGEVGGGAECDAAANEILPRHDTALEHGKIRAADLRHENRKDILIAHFFVLFCLH